MEEFELANGERVQISDRALDGLDSDHHDCPFCLGRATAHRGEGQDTNPFSPEPGVRPRTVGWYDSEYGLWLTGHSLGTTEPGGVVVARATQPWVKIADDFRRQSRMCTATVSIGRC